MKQKATSISDHAHPKITEVTLSFPEFASEWKKTSIHSWDIANYNQDIKPSPVIRAATPIFDHAQPKHFHLT